MENLGVRFFRSHFRIGRTLRHALVQVSNFTFKDIETYATFIVYVRATWSELLRLPGLDFLICKIEMMITLPTLKQL